MIDEPISPTTERRAKQRWSCSLPAKVHGKTADGQDYETLAILANMSACGMYFHTKRNIVQGEILHLLVRLSTAPLDDRPVNRLSAEGIVVRVEPKVDGTWGVALKLDKYHFI